MSAGSRLGPYEIVSAIGEGGMGVVYRGVDTRLGREVAIKVLPDDGLIDDRMLARFENEARLASVLNHPNTVTIYDVGQEGNVRYLAMELIAGSTLQQLFAAGPLPVPQVLHIAAQVADGLAKAHDSGIVHRDLSARNVMVTPDGVAKILDFGLSKTSPVATSPDASTRSGHALTDPGSIVGTVEWMSPEQASGRAVDFQSDQFSFGSLVYALLTGRLPFHRDTSAQTLANIIDGTPPPIAAINPRVPAALDTIVRRCMMKDPQQRYASTRDLALALRQIAGGPPLSIFRRMARRDWLVAGAATLLLSAGAIGGWAWANRPYVPQPSALEWYATGTSALNSMTFDAARKALERAVTLDPKFALAHASLARAYDELDYSERAKESMLRALSAAQDTKLAELDMVRLRALQAVISRDYDSAAPLFDRLEAAATGRGRAAAAVESGWLAQQREDTEGASTAYQRALAIDGSYAAATLRLGFIDGRRGDDARALEHFDEAERIYDAASDHEGVTEALYQRANLLNRRSRAAEALPAIEKALAVAHSLGNTYQDLRLRLLQGSALRNAGDVERAVTITKQAIEAAVDERMDNLATSGLITLGNSYLARLDMDTAEPMFRRALDLAERGRVRRYEALACISLASLLEQRSRPEDAAPFAERALAFYRQAGYRREAVQSMTVLGTIHHELGEFTEAVALITEALAGAQSLKDVQVELRLRERLVGLLQDQGALPGALEEAGRALQLLSPRLPGWFVRVKQAGLLWRLGRPSEAGQAFADIEEAMRSTKSAPWMPALRVAQAELAYGDRRFVDAGTLARGAMALAAEGDENAQSAKLVLALVAIRRGHVSEGTKGAEEVIGGREQAHLVVDAAYTRLATAEALMASTSPVNALGFAQAAAAFFEPRQIWEATWRAHAVAARASGTGSRGTGTQRLGKRRLDEAAAGLAFNERRRVPAAGRSHAAAGGWADSGKGDFMATKKLKGSGKTKSRKEPGEPKFGIRVAGDPVIVDDGGSTLIDQNGKSLDGLATTAKKAHAHDDFTAGSQVCVSSKADGVDNPDRTETLQKKDVITITSNGISNGPGLPTVTLTVKGNIKKQLEIVSSDLADEEISSGKFSYIIPNAGRIILVKLQRDTGVVMTLLDLHNSVGATAASVKVTGHT